MEDSKDYYVYVYIDPRNFEEFYYGKGKGSRKMDHLNDTVESSKVKRIREIQKEGCLPIIRVIAKDLTESEAFLVEKTLLWKLGKYTTNVATGHFSDNFRPHNTYHKDEPGFDFKSMICYYNVGEGVHRNWEDYVEHGFISAGQKWVYGKPMLGFNKGDVVVAYLKGRGFVGVGVVKELARPIREVFINGKSLLSLPLKCRNMGDNSDDLQKSEYVCLVQWVRVRSRENAVWAKEPKLFTSQLIRASLHNQKETLAYLAKAFDVDFIELADRPNEEFV